MGSFFSFLVSAGETMTPAESVGNVEDVVRSEESWGLNGVKSTWGFGTGPTSVVSTYYHFTHDIDHSQY